jgi:hypothetical protein
MTAPVNQRGVEQERLGHLVVLPDKVALEAGQAADGRMRQANSIMATG